MSDGGPRAEPAGGDGSSPRPLAVQEFFPGGGDMGARMRALDWTATPMGPVPDWPPALRSALRMLLSSKAQIVMFWGPDLIAFYNDAYRPTIGSKHPAALGAPAREHWSELWDVLEPLLRGVVTSGESFWAQDHPFLLDRHGYLEETYFDISYDPVHLDDGRVGGVYCIVTETTGRVLGQRRLSTLRGLGSRAAGGGATPVHVASDGLTVLSENPADIPFAQVYLRRGPGEAVVDLVAGYGIDDWREGPGRGTADGVGSHPGEQAIPAVVSKVLATGQAVTAATSDLVPVLPPGAAPRAVVLPIMFRSETSGVLVAGASRLLALEGDYRDFFDLVAAQLSLAVTDALAYWEERRRTGEIAALDRAKSDFFSNVSHELRTPLTLILGPVEEALRRSDLPRQVASDLDVVHRNAMRLLKLTNTVLDFSRLESDQRSAWYAPTDLAGYTRWLASAFSSTAERAGLVMVIDCLPLSRPVHVDREMWEKIVLNLISNALKSTPAGRIEVRVRQVDDAAVLEVSDTGIGIPAEELPRLFQRFHRVPSSGARSHEGTGIGLALVKELVDLHGGTITASSRVHEGSTFRVTVPFGTTHLPPDRLIAQAPALPDGSDTTDLYVHEVQRWAAHAGTPSQRQGGPEPDAARILIADDNADLREYVASLLSPYWHVVAVTDGSAALEVARRERFDLLLTDVMMSGLDGLSLVERLRADPRTQTLPIVLLSARAGEQAAVAGLASGADDYLAKPFTAQELIARVRATVELGQLRAGTIQRLRSLADAALVLTTPLSADELGRAAAAQVRSLFDGVRATVRIDDQSYTDELAGPDADAPVQPMSAPLTGAGRELGELTVWPGPAHRQALAADDAMLVYLARLISLRIENAHLYEAEHRVAHILQHSLLPQRLPQLPGAILAGRYQAGSDEADVGGDWYDAIATPDGRLALVVGDVVGRGVQAAATMGQLRNAVRAYLLDGLSPDGVLAGLNRLAGTLDGRGMATVFCARFDPNSGELVAASAGHPPPVLVGADGRSNLLHRTALGPPIGALPDARFRSVRTQLVPEARLLCYTDGLVESRNQPADAGIGRLVTNLAGSASWADDLDDLLDAAFAQVAPDSQDDIALLALEAHQPDRLCLRLPPDPTRVARVRHRVRDFLRGHGFSERRQFDIVVAVAEAVANAIEHPVGRTVPVVEVDLAVDGPAVIVKVHDHGNWRSPLPRTGHDRGRGLTIIRALADLEIDATAEGTRVRMAFNSN